MIDKVACRRSVAHLRHLRLLLYITNVTRLLLVLLLGDQEGLRAEVVCCIVVWLLEAS
jgi:hypothetical protein